MPYAIIEPINKQAILLGRKAVEVYRSAHLKLHQKPYYRGVHDDHTPLLEKLKDDLKRQGFNSLDDFFRQDKELSQIEVRQQAIDCVKLQAIDWVEFAPQSPYRFVASFEAIMPNSILFAYAPKLVYIGGKCKVKENVNLSYCGTHGIPVVRGILEGRGCAYENGDAIYILFSTKEYFPESLLREVLERAISLLGIDVFVEVNDIRYGSKRVAMTGPEVALNNHFMVGAEILFNANITFIKNCLLFPKIKWVDKPVSVIEEWLCPLNDIKPVSTDAFRTTFIQAFQEICQCNIGLRGLTELESETIESLMGKYRSEEWLLRY